MVMEGDLTWGGEHTVRHTDEIAELYTWNLYIYNFINHCHPNKINKFISHAIFYFLKNMTTRNWKLQVWLTFVAQTSIGRCWFKEFARGTWIVHPPRTEVPLFKMGPGRGHCVGQGGCVGGDSGGGKEARWQWEQGDRQCSAVSSSFSAVMGDRVCTHNVTGKALPPFLGSEYQWVYIKIKSLNFKIWKQNL